ncbi:MAG: ECF transporter S component [Lachnospiraceae bacterium]|nr:ECF transporter S component [Lachnospiraceae bacterium]
MKEKTQSATFELALTALFTAIIIIMAYTPLGYIPLVVINATVIHIPVILGALFLGPKKGAFLGFVFGFTSFLKNTLTPATASAFVFSPVIAYQQIGVSGIFKSAFICFVPRILVGVVPCLVYALVKKFWKGKAATGTGLALAGFSGAFTNTVLVMGGIYVLYRDAYAKATDVAAEKVIDVIMGVVTFNGVIEAALAALLIGVVGAALTVVKPIKSDVSETA